MKLLRMNEIEGVRFPAGRTTKVLTGEDRLPTKNFTLGYVVIEPEGRIPLHTHANEECYLILKGTGRLKMGDREEEVRAFNALYIEPHTEHLLQNTGKEEIHLVFIYAPAGIMDHWSEELSGRLK
ncbi:MAG: dimethylsulfonioproprionate lyase family protein [Desulfobacterota bacterium]|nr:dimethylsulfonioproprionate lyase family protein [Thermodesulfobacteriota bacterium]